jgi:hypothetical protein
VTGGWRKLHKDEFHNLYSLPNIFKVIESRRMKCIGTASEHGRDEKCMQDFCRNTGREATT